MMDSTAVTLEAPCSSLEKHGFVHTKKIKLSSSSGGKTKEGFINRVKNSRAPRLFSASGWKVLLDLGTTSFSQTRQRVWRVGIVMATNILLSTCTVTIIMGLSPVID